MAREDRVRWDEKYRSCGPLPLGAIGPPSAFAHVTDLFPTTGTALDLACGQGRGSVWLARRGLDVWGLDVSSVAIDQARNLANRCGLADRCRFDVADLDLGIPAGPAADIIVCHKFRDRRLDRAIIGRLKSGALLAIATLSEVGASAGPFRAAPGELVAAFADLDVIAAGEGHGEAWLLAQK